MNITRIWDYPPFPYLEQVLSHCHKAGHMYLTLWNKRDKDNKVLVEKRSIHSEYLTNVSSFNHNLRLLAKECLINVHERPSEIEIELVPWDPEGCDVC